MAFKKDMKRSSNVEDEPVKKRLKLNDNFTSKNNTNEIICKVIEKSLCENDIDKKVFTCFTNICNNVQIKIYLKKNLNIFSSTYQALLHVAIKSITSQNKEIAMMCLESVNNGLDFILEAYRTSSIQEKVEQMFLNDLIHLLCFAAKNNYFDINFKLNLCIQKIIFNKQNKLKIKDEKEIDSIYCFNILKDKVQNFDCEQTKACFSKIMEIAKETHDSLLIYYAFKKLVFCLMNEETRLIGIAALLNCVKDITFDFTNEVEEKTLKSFLENILQERLSSEYLSKYDYDILESIAKMDALIFIDNKIEIWLKKVFNTKSEESVGFMKLLLNISITLKQENKFAVWLLNAVKESLKQDQCNLQVCRFIDSDFLTSFSELIFRIVNKQAHNILKTLMHFLKVEIIEKIDADVKDDVIIMFQVETKLLIALFNGYDMQHNLRTEAAGEKFVLTMIELKEMLNELLSKSLKVEFNNILMKNLLQIIYKWEYYTWIFIQHYDHKNIQDFSTLSIDEKKLQKLYKKVLKCGENYSKNIVYEYVLFRMRTKGENGLVKYNNLSEFSSCWKNLLQTNHYLLQFLNKDQVNDLAVQILEDLLHDESIFDLWKKLYNGALLENNAQFTAALACQIFGKLQTDVSCKSIQEFLEDINFDEVLIFAAEDSENNLSDILSKLKERVFRLSWDKMDKKYRKKVKDYLKILHNLKIEFLSLNFKRIVFMLLCSICRTCETDKLILDSCSLIFSDLLYGNEDGFSKYVHPLFYLTESFRPYLFDNLFLQSLKKKKLITPMKEFLLSDSFELQHASTLLKCIENVRLKCKDEKAKEHLKDLCTTACDVILKRAKVPMINSCEIKALTLTLKENVSGESLDENKKKVITDALHYLMSTHFKEPILELKSEEEVTLLNATNELIMETLFSKEFLDIKKDALKFLYKSDVKVQTKISPLFKIYEKEDFIEYYGILHERLIIACKTSDEALLKNCIMNWTNIIQADVGTNQELRMKKLAKALITLFDCKLDTNLWEIVLQFIHVIMSTTKLSITKAIIDTCIMIMEKCLRQNELTYCLYTLQFCSDLFIHRTEFALDRTSIVLDIFENSVKCIIRKSRTIKEENTTKITILLNSMEKVIIALNKFKKIIGRSYIYILANLIKCYSEGSVPPYVKDSLQVCIGTILSTFDQYAISFLHRCISEAENTIFDSFYDTYKKHYKFTGKI